MNSLSSSTGRVARSGSWQLAAGSRLLMLVALLGVAPLAGQTAPPSPSTMPPGHQHTPGMTHPAPARDTTFGSMQERGRGVMGVDQYASRHAFEPLPDGGRIELLMIDGNDSASIVEIRAHLNRIAGQFAEGNFSAASEVHEQVVPGTVVMTAKQRAIRYTMRNLPRGGEVRITTNDRDVVAAIHEFLAFQRTAHHAGER